MHPDALQTFEDGWAALPRRLVAQWNEDQGARKPIETEHTFQRLRLRSLYMYLVFTEGARLRKQNRDRFLPYPKPIVPPIFQNTPNPYQMTSEALLDGLDHEGVLYGLSPVVLSQQ